MPEQYHQFLKADASRANFSSYPAKQRLQAFAHAFGPKFTNLEARLKRFIVNLKVPSK